MNTWPPCGSFMAFTGQGARELKMWLIEQAEDARSNDDLARRFVEQCRKIQIIVPAISTIERQCANALVAAERKIEQTIPSRLGSGPIKIGLSKMPNL